MRSGGRGAGGGSEKRRQSNSSEKSGRRPAHALPATRYELIVIGCSLGGMTALKEILCSLPAGFETPIAIAQHRHRKSSESLPDFYRRSCKLRVVDAEDKQWIKQGTVYFAPANYHLLVAKGEFNLSVDDLVRYSRPSIDVLFESAADAYGRRLIGVVLTGANDDGTEGAKHIKHRGGLVVAQDPETAEAPEMPRAVMAAGAVDQILPLEHIAPFLVDRCRVVTHS